MLVKMWKIGNSYALLVEVYTGTANMVIDMVASQNS